MICQGLLALNNGCFFNLRRWCVCFNPEADKNVIWKALKDDLAILELMGLTGKTNLEIAKQIIKRSTWDDMLTNEKRLCIYFRPSRLSRNEIITNEILQIDCHVPAKQDYIADRIISRIVKLLNNKNLNGAYLKFAGQLGELPTLSGFYCAGVRFDYYNPFI